MLSKSPAVLTESVWNLLQKLPINSKLHHDLSQLEGAGENWNSLLDSRSTHKLLYSLKIIEELKFSPSPAEEPQPEEPADPEAEASPKLKISAAITDL